MISWTIRQLKRLPTPLNLIVGAVLLVLLLGLFLVALNQVRACGYDKARRDYEARDQVKAAESEKLKARADALEQRAATSEKRVAELEPKLAAYETLAEQKKKVDDSITQQIDAVTKEAQHEAEVTDVTTDCATRANRTCAKFTKFKPPIQIDCDAYRRKLCGK